MKPPILSNNDFSIIINGMHDDPPSLSSFVSTFTKHNISNCFCRVGYDPFTRECLNSKYIRHELVEDTVNNTCDSMVAEYETSNVRLKEE